MFFEKEPTKFKTKNKGRYFKNNERLGAIRFIEQHSDSYFYITDRNCMISIDDVNNGTFTIENGVIDYIFDLKQI